MKKASLFRPLNWALVALSATVLSGCISSLPDFQSAQTDPTKVPDWVLSPPSDRSHLYGVGSAPRIDNLALAFAQAEQNGNAQIAQQLRTQVSQLNTQDTQVSSTSGQNEQVIRVQSAYTQVKTAPIELEQTVNEQRFAGDDYVYVLQSIDRQRIIAKLTEALKDTDDKIRSAAASLSTSPDQTAAQQDWRTYMRLIPLFAQRKNYQDELNLYSTQAALLGRADKSLQATEQQLNQALNQFGFDVSGTEQSDLLASELSQYGLTAKQDAVFTLTSKTSHHTQMQQGRYYVFQEGTLSLIGADQRHLASWTVRARGIDKNPQSAEGKAAEDWSQQAVSKLFNWLTNQP
ncbi:LPP20 family lipoprotein [Marinomonas pollencensis]|uniref:LPP20 lipoprotein n=1 Tax=Marinomonas pollencensis TaxID=491954 RepID=A0A3E0DJ52_9GAMM|nr:LPP20 family lipoprotein [Marinomonas pollencensis]REG82643.1 LPP20 lipoprotein [Marinomonas pollencensis]